MANKKLGQHWLTNRKILDYIADLAAKSDDGTEYKLCLEIGPGLGHLTSSLLKRFNKVVAVEYDKKLADNLPKSFPGTNLEVVADDFLGYEFRGIQQPYVIAGNIPYYITNYIIRRIITLPEEQRPKQAVLLVQKEVVDRITEVKGSSHLSTIIKNRAEVEPGMIVKASEFDPAPKVDSQVLVLKMRDIPLWPYDPSGFWALLAIIYPHPRKNILNNLMSILTREKATALLDIAGIKPNSRPGDLSFDDIINIFRALKMLDDAKMRKYREDQEK